MCVYCDDEGGTPLQSNKALWNRNEVLESIGIKPVDWMATGVHFGSQGQHDLLFEAIKKLTRERGEPHP